MKRPAIILLIAVAVAFAGLWYLLRPERQSSPDGAKSALTIPKFSADAQAGQILFDGNCMQCHGANATGTNQGPPLIHPIYEPNHHGDFAFLNAVRNGARNHHWPFGDMPSIAGVSAADVEKIVTYVREIQRANGIR